LDDKTFHLLEKTQVPYTWFAGTGQGKIDWDGERYSVKFNVRILHDSIIWMQISKLGFEVGRNVGHPGLCFFYQSSRAYVWCIQDAGFSEAIQCTG
jgi:hypothetical protein